MGYRAVDLDTNKFVCIKIFKEDNQFASKTFTAEVQALILSLDHPGIVKMLKVDVAELMIGG